MPGINETKRVTVLPFVTGLVAVGLAASLVFAVAAASAAGEFPYYPEYADRISQYEVVTPLLAKKFALEKNHPNAVPGSFLCEPLLVRDIEGAPFFYAVAFYNGHDEDALKRWNEIVAIFQTTGKTSSIELAEKLSFFGADDVRGKFCSMTVLAYTFGTGPYKMYGGIPTAVRGYETAYAKAAQELGTEDLFFSRLIGASYIENQIFEFESRSGEKAAIHVTVTGRYVYQAVIADLKGNATQAKAIVKGWYDFLVNDPDSANKRRDKWEEIDRKVPDEVAGQELPRVTGENVGHIEWAKP